MSSNNLDAEHDAATVARIERLESYHQDRHGLLLAFITLGFIGFVVWAMTFRIDEVARASGEVITSSRVQIIQSVDGGVLSQLEVEEGERVKPGQVLARLDQTRVSATAGEVEARLFALKAKVTRLRAEVSGDKEPAFPTIGNNEFRKQIAAEHALFKQRRNGLQDELNALQVAEDLAHKELDLIQQLLESGDVSGSELLRAQRTYNDAKSDLINRKNAFLEQARIELAKAEDEIAQNEQIFTRRERERADSVFVAQVAGIVKNIRITTVGGVLRAGEEIMQIVPVDDELVVEAKVRPADIAHIESGLATTIRFDAFDYTIFGAVDGTVTFVSADTLKEESSRGEEIYYRVRVSPAAMPTKTTTGRSLNLLPGMTAKIDIRTGDRTVMEYLLKPLRKTMSEAFRER